MAFGEEKVEDLVYRVEPFDELRGVGADNRNVMVDQVLGRALKSLLDCFVVDQERAGDFGDSKTTEFRNEDRHT